MLKTILHKIIFSSVDPQKIALTIKSGIPFLVFILPIFGVVNIGEGELTHLVDSILVLITGLMTAYGLGRKLYYEILAL